LDLAVGGDLQRTYGGASGYRAFDLTCSVSLESYHPYLQAQKVSKNPKIYCIHSSPPKNKKHHFGSFGILGVNIEKSDMFLNKDDSV
jgi:hypothetical protein